MGKRIEYLDAMRGFTMTLVIIGHVFAYCMNHGNVINTELTNLRLPLFFFVSGFLVYKDDLIWNFRNLFSFIKKKFRQQIIPTIFFVFVCNRFFGNSGKWYCASSKDNGMLLVHLYLIHFLFCVCMYYVFVLCLTFQ